MKKAIILTIIFVCACLAVAADDEYKTIGEPCTSDSDCIQHDMTKHGMFSLYCESGLCAPADGISNSPLTYDGLKRKTPLQNCGADSDCQNLYYGFSSSAPSSSASSAVYDFINKPVTIFEHGSPVIKTYYSYFSSQVPYAFWTRAGGWSYLSTDPEGKPLETIDSRGVIARYAYDEHERQFLKTVIGSEDTKDYNQVNCWDSYCLSDEQCNVYGNSFNLLCEVVYNQGTIKYFYDQRDRVKKETFSIYDEVYGIREYELSYTYYDNDALKTMTLPEGSIIKYFYDSSGATVRIVLESEGNEETIAEFSHTPSGKLEKKILNPNVDPIESDFFYDEKEDLRAMVYSASSGKIFERGMDYDKVGNVQAISYSVDESDPLSLQSTDEDFAYDNWYRLTDAIYGADHFEYTYYANNVGDREKKILNDVETSYDYNQKGQLESFGETTYAYDNKGNIISQTNPGMDFKYDAQNRLVHVEYDGTFEEYTYDMKHSRVKKKDSSGTTFYVYKGNNVVYQEDIPIGVCPNSCGDINSDGTINLDDLNRLISIIYGTQIGALCAADMDGSGEIDYDDIMYLASYLLDDESSHSLDGCGSIQLAQDPQNFKPITTLFQEILDIMTPKEYVCGDMNGDLSINIGDMTHLVSYLFSGGPAPVSIAMADINHDGAVNIADMTYLVSFLFSGGASPDCTENKNRDYSQPDEDPTGGYTLEQVQDFITYASDGGELTLADFVEQPVQDEEVVGESEDDQVQEDTEPDNEPESIQSEEEASEPSAPESESPAEIEDETNSQDEELDSTIDDPQTEDPTGDSMADPIENDGQVETETETEDVAEEPEEKREPAQLP